MKLQLLVVTAVISMILMSSNAHADVQTYFDFEEWSNTIDNNFTTIDFTGFPDDTEITDQYADLGAIFPNFNVISGPGPAFPNDGWGLRGFAAEPPFFEEQPITVEFSQPMSWVAVHFPGFVMFELYSDDELIYESDGISQGFGGLVSDATFDRIVLSDFDGSVFIDDLHFGPPIPGPGALAVLTLGAVAVNRRRRE